MWRFQTLTMVVSFFALSACAPAPDPATPTLTVESATATAIVSPTADAAGVPSQLPTISFGSTLAVSPSTPAVPLPTLAATVTPTAAVLPAGFSPILMGKKYDADMFFVLMGGVQEGSWMSVDQAVLRIPGAAVYDVYAFSSGPHHVYGYAPYEAIPQREYFQYLLSTDSVFNESGMIGVAHGWQTTHQVAEELPPDNDVYQQLVKDFLAQSGMVDPQIGTMHIYRIDLEGDGTDEIVISDTRLESQHRAAAGDHSIVLLRKVTGSGVVTIPIVVDLYAALGYGNPFPCSYFVANFLDLNQDGVLEVIVGFDRWEAFGGSVHQVQAETAEKVLGTHCFAS